MRTWKDTWLTGFKVSPKGISCLKRFKLKRYRVLYSHFNFVYSFYDLSLVVLLPSCNRSKVLKGSKDLMLAILWPSKNELPSLCCSFPSVKWNTVQH